MQYGQKIIGIMTNNNNGTFPATVEGEAEIYSRFPVNSAAKFDLYSCFSNSPILSIIACNQKTIKINNRYLQTKTTIGYHPCQVSVLELTSLMNYLTLLKPKT